MEINEATASRENANIGILLPLIFIPKHPKRTTVVFQKQLLAAPFTVKFIQGVAVYFHFICCSAQFISLQIYYLLTTKKREKQCH